MKFFTFSLIALLSFTIAPALNHGSKYSVAVNQVDTIAFDKKANEKRFIQKAVGIEMTVVNGEVLVEKGDHTGALPGSVLGSGNGKALQAAA